MATDWLDATLRSLLQPVPGVTPAPGGGAVAAVSIALAAELIAMTARASAGQWPEGAAAAAQAVALRDRATQAARDEGVAFPAAIEALRSSRAATGDPVTLGHALDEAAALTVRIAQSGADVADLASFAVTAGHPDLRADAVVAVVLAEAGARAAAHLVAINLAVTQGDARLEAAQGAAASAAAARERAVGVN
jgi:formiminotetrahydrofolate cyclodeaminase